MQLGDEIKIKGSFGFLWEPTVKIIEIKGDLILVEPVDAKSGGLLSHLNQTWIGKDQLFNKTYAH